MTNKKIKKTIALLEKSYLRAVKDYDWRSAKTFHDEIERWERKLHWWKL